MPKISIVIPIHEMKNGSFFLWRAVNSIMEQTFKDYEIVIVKEGKMAENTNAGIKKAKGQLIKILYLDDYLAHPNALQEIADNFEFMDEWMITGADTNPHPYWTDDIATGNNRLGSPSALTIRNGLGELFDERMSWLLDCDLYKRLNDRYGPPKILDSVGVCIGTGDHQMTNILTDEEKLLEHKLIEKKYEQKSFIDGDSR
jgi:glycosyltransferase involved in cell wall biosynthesis